MNFQIFARIHAERAVEFVHLLLSLPAQSLAPKRLTMQAMVAIGHYGSPSECLCLNVSRIALVLLRN